MKILIRQFLGKNHSWSVVGRGLAKALKKNHQVHLFSTDGLDQFPSELKPNLIGAWKPNSFDLMSGKIPDQTYDLGISYTTMKNFPYYLSNCDKKIGIWCYEWAGKNAIPAGFAKHINSIDWLMPPSSFAKEVLKDSGIDEKKMFVLPHGIDDSFKNQKSLQFSTKKCKIGVVLGQLHDRKNIYALLESYARAFSKTDSTCLLLKVSKKDDDSISIDSLLGKLKTNYPNHGEIKIISKFIERIADFYASCDLTFTMSHAEAFYFPALESLASGILPIAPNYGGQLDFLNENNSLLINGEIVESPAQSMYWDKKQKSFWFEPSIDHAVLQLREAYRIFEEKNKELKKNIPEIFENYSWDSIAKKMLEKANV